MANKIPVGATIAQTYRFAFANFLNNLAVAWVPIVLMIVASYLAMPGYIKALSQLVAVDPGSSAEAIAAANQHNLPLILSAVPYIALVWLVMIFCLPSAYAAVTKEALGLRQGTSYLQFPFGKPMWRLLGAMVLYMLGVIAAYIAFIVIVIATGTVLGLVTGGAQASNVVSALARTATFAVGVTAFCVFAYGVVIFGFLIAPVTVAEERISLTRGWRLARRNFWRIIGLMLSVVLPLSVVNVIYLLVIFPDYFSMLSSLGQGERSMQFLVAMADSLQSHWYVYFPVSLILYVLLVGLLCGTSAFSYRALVDGEALQELA